MKALSVLCRGSLGALENGIRQNGHGTPALHLAALAKGRLPALPPLTRRYCASRQFSSMCPRALRRREPMTEKQILKAFGVDKKSTKRSSPLDIYEENDVEAFSKDLGLPDDLVNVPVGDDGPSDEASFAFAFDIDGVLLHQSEPLPGATDSLKFLQANKIPFILLTNGGGKHEHERVAELSEKLGVSLTTDHFVQSHTPFSELHDLKDKNILVTGSNAAKAREIAESYGFAKVITPADILMANPTIWPFDPLLESVYASTARPLPKPIFSGYPHMDPLPRHLLRDYLRIHAVFVFNDPRDWALDIQIISDLLLSHRGVLGTYSHINGMDGDWQQDEQPRIFYSNSDLLWASKHPMPRLGQGAFQAALAGVWAHMKGNLGGTPPRHSIHCTRFGKPIPKTYRFAERMLLRHRRSVLGPAKADSKRLKTVYMVGDNPESDIAGANNYRGRSQVGADWLGILVKTGVFNPDILVPLQHKPEIIVDDVYRGIRWALNREKWQGPALVRAVEDVVEAKSTEEGKEIKVETEVTLEGYQEQGKEKTIKQ